ncbi:MAG: (deoxy)nucleoside triphosphate pyrophosphohydrolase [Lachnospiraceae bacterium]|nr:(deoxy)nucleoside triphosphate pyrophosphohydrolase [Lachnospiraceae bacterium]
METDSRKVLRVVAAVIERRNAQGKFQIYATQRGYGDLKGGWEFPGGKIEQGETAQQALAREIEEELNMEICVGDYIYTVEYDYPKFHLSMDCFWCRIESGEPELLEHLAAKWLTWEELCSVEWLPADAELFGGNRKILRRSP